MSHKSLHKQADGLMYKLNTIEIAHEMYAAGLNALEPFYTRFKQTKNSKLMPLLNYWQNDDNSLASVLTDLLNEDERKITEVLALHDKFTSMQLPSERFQSVLDMIQRELKTLNNNRFKKIVPNGSMSFGMPSSSDMTANAIQSIFNQIQYTFDDAMNGVRNVVPSMSNTNLSSELVTAVNRFLSSQNIANTIGDVIQTTEPHVKAMTDHVKKLLDLSKRITDKNFDKFIKTFHRASTDPLKDQLTGVEIPYTLEELTQVASLAHLYNNAVISALNNTIDGTYDDIKRLLQAFRRKDEKRVVSLLKDLHDALEHVKPNNPQSPNFSSNRSARFSWSDVKARLRAITDVFGDAESTAAVDQSIERQGVLYRKPDNERLLYYVKLVREFQESIKPPNGNLVTSLDGAMKNLNTRTEDMITVLNEEIKKLPTDDQTYLAFQTSRLALRKYNVLVQFLGEAKRLFNKYLQLHLDFALKTNRQGARYMAYWKAAEIANADATAHIDEYMRVLTGDAESIQAIGKVQLATWMNLVRGTMERSENITDMEPDEAQRLGDKLALFEEWHLDKAEPLIIRIHDGPVSILDVLADSQFLMLYGLKLLRFLLVFLSLALARRVFQGIYNEKVYTQNAAPPHPAMMVAIFLGIDIGFAVALVVILSFIKYLFYHGAGTFPVDGFLISRFILDYCLSTLVIATLAFIISDVICKRKYFRYRYEGERGVRALELMIRYTSGVIIALPFFRMAD